MTTQIAPGQLVAGKFRVESLLGEGAMGVVVAAHHIGLDERVAIKFLRPSYVDDPEIVARFLREARSAVKIRSEHVARVTDVGTLETGAPYIVMEYLEGVDLQRLIQQKQPLSIAESVDVILQAGEAIAEAHGLGIVHRDLKPANLFLADRPDGSREVKVLDFGISKLLHPDESAITKVSGLMGSPAYMSPEQLRSLKDLDGRADIWALGVILYELLAGTRPFVGEDLPQLCVKILQGSPAPIREARPDVPVPLAGAVLRALAKDRSARFSNMAELAAALQPFGSRRSLDAAERISRLAEHSSSKRGFTLTTLSSGPPAPVADAGPVRSDLLSAASVTPTGGGDASSGSLMDATAHQQTISSSGQPLEAPPRWRSKRWVVAASVLVVALLVSAFVVRAVREASIPRATGHAELVPLPQEPALVGSPAPSTLTGEPVEPVRATTMLAEPSVQPPPVVREPSVSSARVLSPIAAAGPERRRPTPVVRPAAPVVAPVASGSAATSRVKPPTPPVEDPFGDGRK